jgi:hypothetical protein
VKREGVPRGITRVGQVSKHCHVSLSHWSMSAWVSDKWTPTHTTWHSPTGPHQQPLHQAGTNGSTWLSHVDKGRPCGIHLFDHIINYSTRRRHMADSGWATSTTRSHVAPSYWSTSASGPHPGTSHLTGGPHLSATWQSFNGPPHPTLCHMAASQAAISPVYAIWQNTM